MFDMMYTNAKLFKVANEYQYIFQLVCKSRSKKAEHLVGVVYVKLCVR